MTDVASLSVSATETGVAKVDSALLGLAKSAGVAESATGRFTRSAAGIDAMFKSSTGARDRAKDVEHYAQEMDNLRAKYNPLFAASRQYETALEGIAVAERKGAITANEAAAARTRLATSLAPDRIDAAGNSMKNFGGHTANVFAQLNDIGMMMAAGQNPLQLALQQGTQLNQVWGQMGGKIGAVGAVLRGAFLSLLNPLNLVTIGVIAGGAALLNYFTSAGSGAKTFKENLDELEGAIGNLNDVTNMYSDDGLAKLKDKYGTLNAEIMELIDNQRILALDEASRKLQSVLASMSGELGSGWLTTANGEVAELFETTSTGASLLLQYMSSIKDMKTFQEQADALAIMRENLSRATDGFTDMTAEQAAMFRKLVDAESQMRILEQSTLKAENAAIDLTASAPGAGWMASAISETNMLIGKLTKAKAVSDGLRNVKMGDLASQYGQYGAGRTSGEKLNRDASALYGGTGNVLDGMGYYDTSGGASGGGGGGGSDPYQANLDRLMSSLMTERETVEKWYADNEVILNDRRAMELLGAAGHKEAMLDLERQYHEKLSKIKDDSASMSLTGMSTYFGELNSIAGGGFDGLIRAQKAFAAAQLAIDQVKALSAIWGDASIPFLAKGFAIGRTLAAFAGLKSALSGGKGASGGGSSKAPTSVGGAAAEPTRTTTVSFQGDPFMVAIAESVMSQMYAASGNGRVLIKA